MVQRRWTAEDAARSKLHAAVANTSAGSGSDGADRRRVVAELQDLAGDYPHLLAEVAGICLGAHRVNSAGREHYLTAVDLFIAAGADLAAVERWAVIGADNVRRSDGRYAPKRPQP